TAAAQLHKAMRGVSCVGGSTQIARVLTHARKEARANKVNALVFVGDAMEEKVDELCRLAGELGLLGAPVFVFHEGGDEIAGRAFRQIAKLSGGAYCPFDTGSAQQLRELLGAVAAYAAGGRPALLDYGKRKGGAALLLSGSVGNRK
ncbi:MAG: VWA domain-containing protein, partial [Hyphomicrobiales bacterium]